MYPTTSRDAHARPFIWHSVIVALIHQLPHFTMWRCCENLITSPQISPLCRQVDALISIPAQTFTRWPPGWRVGPARRSPGKFTTSGAASPSLIISLCRRSHSRIKWWLSDEANVPRGVSQVWSLCLAHQSSTRIKVILKNTFFSFNYWPFRGVCFCVRVL